MSDIHVPPSKVSMANISSAIESGVNDVCHAFTGGVKAHQKHSTPNPRVVPIFWGHNYVTNPNDVTAVVQLLSDLVTGPFMNGLVQYGVSRGSVASSILIDTNRINPAPATLDEKQARDQIVSWIKASTVTPTPSVDETNLLYFLFPPTTTQLTLSDGTTGFCGYHQHAKFNNSSQNDDLFWAIAGTSGAPSGTGTRFANSLAFCVSHELDEAFSNRDDQGYLADNGCEIGDICECTAGCLGGIITFPYRGWSVEPYWSNWDSTCIHGDQPVSLRKFLGAIGFDIKNKGLRSLNTPVINLEYIASRMR